jgi:curved DNA-binding protein CbpA
VPGLAPEEIKALARLIDELDYYQLLEIPRDAPGSAVRRAYHGLSRRFHPDANRGLPADLRTALEVIAKRVAEAYSVLREPRRRRAYDAHLAEGDGGTRIQLVEAETRASRQVVEETLGRTPNGRRFFGLARAEIDRGDLQAAARNIQMALTFEPDNAFFRDKLAEVRAAQR